MVMDAFEHVEDAVGEECDTCGTTHEVIESIDDDPMSPSAVDELAESEEMEFVEPLGFFNEGRFHKGGQGNQQITTHVVASTESGTRALGYYDGHGWVKLQEWDHDDHERPAAVGEEMVDEINKQMMKKAESIPKR